jgi:catechol 2,3-dioxygenase
MTRTLQMETPAHLHHLHVVTAEPERLAAFYKKHMDLQPLASTDGRIVLAGPQRAVEISRVNDGMPAYSGYAVDTHTQLHALKIRLENADVQCVPATSVLYEPGAFGIADPQERRVVFGVSKRLGAGFSGAPGRLQHTVYQTTELERVVRFYVERVGFAI